MFLELGSLSTARRNFANMRRRIEGFLVLAALLVLIAGCDNTANTNNRTANANRRAPTREEYERDKERYNREAKGQGRTIGTGVNDGWLWVKTRFDLAAADDLRDSTIHVDVGK